MSEWISVEDKMPNLHQQVWYYFEITGVSLGHYYGDGCFVGNRGFLCGDVTHWQPAEIPEPPNET